MGAQTEIRLSEAKKRLQEANRTDMVTSRDWIMEVWVTERTSDISTHNRSATEHKVRVQQKVRDLWVCVRVWTNV